MILQTIHQVVDCPICGRPLELDRDLVSHEIACGHCRGEFSVYEAHGGLMTATSHGGIDLLQRAEELLRASGDTKASNSSEDCERPSPSDTTSRHVGQSVDSRLTLLEETEYDAKPLPVVVLVEPRDEVFARIATDVAEFGMRVIRARSATEALNLCGSHEPVLVVSNVDLPDQSGWLLAAKLRFVDRHTHIWLYKTQVTDYDLGMVNFLNVDESLNYAGDLLGLSDSIIDLMAEWCEQRRASNNEQNVAAA